jgi:hypothetical protein
MADTQKPVLAVQGSPTSEEAARTLSPGKRAIDRERVYVAIAASPSGMTDDELQAALDLDGSTERPRRLELFEQGRIARTGRTRSTRAGKRAAVWIAVR